MASIHVTKAAYPLPHNIKYKVLFTLNILQIQYKSIDFSISLRYNLVLKGGVNYGIFL